MMGAVAEQRDRRGVGERTALARDGGERTGIAALWQEADGLAARREAAVPVRVEAPATPRPEAAPRARFHLD